MRALVLALGLLASQAAAADQFDLVCKANNDGMRYRVDLARGEWCFGKCEMVQKIASVTSGMIVLADHQPAYRGDFTAYTRVNRVSGEWEWFASGAQNVHGSCEPAPFTGITAGPTKF